MSESTLNSAIRQFEAVEANLVKIEKALEVAIALIPGGIAFGDEPDYDRAVWTIGELLEALPPIDGWKPSFGLLPLDEIAQRRLDAQEIDEVEILISLQQEIDEPSRLLREYRFRFDKKRRQLVRDAVLALVDAVDDDLRRLQGEVDEAAPAGDDVESSVLDELRAHVAQIGALLGSSATRPPRWGDLLRHLSFGQNCDIRDVISLDWPSVKPGIQSGLYGETEPIPVAVADLADLVDAKPTGAVATQLKWESLADEDFERLIYSLISSEPGYENPQWLTRTNAPDRGRDLSVDRIQTDGLTGTNRQRVIIQCKHWLTKSVSPAEVALLKDQMRMHEPPRVDVCVIASSGRFTSDAIKSIELNNTSDTGLRIEMWPESHLELLLAGRPWLIAEFGLR